MLRTSINSIKALYRSQVIRFLVVGVFSFLIEFALFTLLVEAFGMVYTQANLPAMTVSVIVNYFLTRRVVFEAGRYNGKVTFSLFVFFTLAGLALNQFLLWFLVEKIQINISISKVLAISAVAVFNYFAKKYIVFRK